MAEIDDAQGLYTHAAQHYERVLGLAEGKPSDVSCYVRALRKKP
jgi:hypothetical protein